ncbi:MAG: DNA helicase RecQ [Cellvibrionales bacterium TMED49]|nr:DNA helicase RecQ [Porticoccaceae bacterium]OUU40205.1 MAG: DNA helicase RecQ [Cellvibrionales bacterium TMED49]RPG91288.1 MAG: DNA helicase RecQ [Cellvibrionales bacterium TMED148]|tara:strand:+ start:3685 stop:5475 length:1791 start_codon:yes stop_codon:yes gene_type:complete
MIPPLDILNRFFGYDSFRSPQEAIIDTIVTGENALVLMPTGGGKSLCYQIPSIAREGCGVVISPLIALMQNQVQALKINGIRAEFLNSTLQLQDAAAIEQMLLDGELELLYMAPERLAKPSMLSLLRKSKIGLFAIDEAHCISQWGHNFRQDYLKLELLAKEFPEVPRIALTATADTRTRKEIAAKLNLTNAKHFVVSFDRPNIRYQIALKQNYRQQLLRFLRDEHSNDSGVIYCLSRKKTEEVAEWLPHEGFNALPYHAGLSSEQRDRHQSRFLNEDGIIIVATIAFGMGIDKPDVRFVVHLDLPKTIESYYQETGRAGRDGEPANAWMVYGLGDVGKLRTMFAKSRASEDIKRIEQMKLNALLGFCEITTCRRKALLNYFDEDAPDNCNNCDTCLYPVGTFDGTEAAQKALSTVLRTEQKFGYNHLVDVLLGRTNSKVIEQNHDRLSVFGIGQDFNAYEWKSLFRQLLARGYLKTNEHGSLIVEERSRAVLKGYKTIQLRSDTRTKTAKQLTKTSLPNNIDVALWEILRAKRRELADAQDIPPYVIFHDRTLKALAAEQPRDLKHFARLHGVGDRKLKKYGLEFIMVIKQYLNQ